MSFLGFGRRKDPGLERQRQALQVLTPAFKDIEERLAGLADLRVSFAEVWTDVAEINEVQAKVPAMRELLGLMQQRADHATRELPKFDDSVKLLAGEIAYADRLLQDLVATLMTKQAMVKSGIKPS
ncbi:MAG TPA: hypothetical protein VHR41_19105 [Gemmatimonadales bacterium]|nr:hypothetical protein [Gemmatimonadales bacterium]